MAIPVLNPLTLVLLVVLLAELAAPQVEVQAQRRWPDAAALFRIGVIDRAAPVGRLAQHPIDPGLQGEGTRASAAAVTVGSAARTGGAVPPSASRPSATRRSGRESGPMRMAMLPVTP